MRLTIQFMLNDSITNQIPDPINYSTNQLANKDNLTNITNDSRMTHD